MLQSHRVPAPWNWDTTRLGHDGTGTQWDMGIEVGPLCYNPIVSQPYGRLGHSGRYSGTGHTVGKVLVQGLGSGFRVRVTQ